MLKYVIFFFPFYLNAQVNVIEIKGNYQLRNGLNLKVREKAGSENRVETFHIDRADSTAVIKRYPFRFFTPADKTNGSSAKAGSPVFTGAGSNLFACDTVLNILVQKKSDSLYYLWPDLNFDHDFQDERPLPVVPGHVYEGVTMVYFQCRNNGDIVKIPVEIGVEIQPEPGDKESPGGFSLFIIRENSVKGTFSYKEVRYGAEIIQYLMNEDHPLSFILLVSPLNQKILPEQIKVLPDGLTTNQSDADSPMFRIQSVDMWHSRFVLSVNQK